MRSRLLIAFFLLISVVAILIGCASSGSGVPPVTGVQITLDTPTVDISPSGTINLVVHVTNATDPSVVWSVVGGDSNGTIAQDGTYSAPSSTGIYKVVAVSVQDPGAQAFTTVHVNSGVNMTLGPQNATVKVGSTRQFSATITGTGNTLVSYFVPGSGTGGEIDTTGLYTAPENPGTYQVQCTLTSDPSIVSRTLVHVVPGVDMRLTFPTTTLRTLPNSTIQLRANVTGTTDKSITWTIQEGAVAGTINSDGLFKAGATEGYYNIVGTSNADPTISVSYRVLVAPSARIRVETNKGTFILKLRPDLTPRHCANIVSLTNAGFYDGILFHRFEPGFVIQGGDPLTKTLPLDDPRVGTGGPGYTIDLELSTLKHEKYALAMARSSGVNTAGSQWYVTLAKTPSLDGQYTVFGLVDENTSVIDLLRAGDVIQKMTVVP